MSPEDITTAQQQLQTRLQQVPLFARCHPADLRVVARRCELRQAPANTPLIRGASSPTSSSC